MKKRNVLLPAVAAFLVGGSLCLPGFRNLQVNHPTSSREPEAQERAGEVRASGVKRNPSSRARPDAGRDLRRRAWETTFLSGLSRAAVGDKIAFELLRGERAGGTVGMLKVTNGEVISVSGSLTEPELGRFFFQRQSGGGVGGGVVGVIEFWGSERAYRLEPTGPGGSAELVERTLGEVLCFKLPRAPGELTNRVAAIPPLNPGQFPDLPSPTYQNGISRLDSLHGAKAVIYLDFQGGYTPTWGGVTYEKPALTKEEIREVWQRVAEDFMPFNINVTTDLRTFEAAPLGGRQRVIITPTSTASPDSGGVAYIGSFGYSEETPCWVFMTNPKACAEACAHELGHSLGLGSHKGGQNHDGQHVDYYIGQGYGATSWAPIMGVGYYCNVSQWSRGEYLTANNTDDELGSISRYLVYRADDVGNSLATSRFLELYPDYSASAEGVIEHAADTDAFQFTTAGGLVSLRAEPVGIGPNLALAVSLCDSNDLLVVSNCPTATLDADLVTNLPAGTYTFRVTGAGRNDPLTNGFSSYGSLGYYSITGSVANARLPDRFTIQEHATNGSVVGVLSRRNPNQDSLAYAIVSGNLSNTFAIDPAGVLKVADGTWLDYSWLALQTQLAVQFELFVNLTDLQDPSLSETNRRVVVTVLPLVGPPVIVLQPQSQRVLASRPAELQVVATTGQSLFNSPEYQWFFNGNPIAGATRTSVAFSDVQAPMEGDYQVVIVNSYGSVTSSVATLTVEAALPSFVLEPSSQDVLLGSRAHFQAKAVGTEPIGYQWEFRREPLVGETSGALVLASTRSVDQGLYRLVASNSVGVIASSEAELTLHALLAWGENDSGQTNIPAGLSNIVQIAAGARHDLALSRDGIVSAWGGGEQTNVPSGLTEVTAISAGGTHSLALTAEGTVRAWGENDFGQVDVPLGLTNVVSLSAGFAHSLALLVDGTVVAWGLNTHGQCNVPAGLSNVVAIAAGANHSLALRAGGIVLGWGDGQFGQTSVPTNVTDVVAISAGAQHSVALKANGVVVAWGSDQNGQISVPLSLRQGTLHPLAIAAGAFHNLALLPDGSVLGWGALEVTSNLKGVLGMTALAAGRGHSIVLAGDGAPFVTEPPMGLTAFRDSRVVFRASATGTGPLSFQWQHAGTNLVGATDSLLVLEDAAEAGDYRVIVSNALGIATSSAANLTLLEQAPYFVTQPLSQTAFLGSHLQLSVSVNGSKPLFYQWRFDGGDLPNATNSTLNLDHLSMAHSGTYSVIVSNDSALVSSKKALVRVVQVISWGDARFGQTNVPAGLTGVVQVAGGYYHSLGLKADGTVVAWGASGLDSYYNYGQTTVPFDLTDAVAIAAGAYHSLALRANGRVVAWGAGATDNRSSFGYGQSMVPNGLDEVVAIAAGQYHSVALRSDGRVVVWGASPVLSVTNVPPSATNVVAVTCDTYSVTALKADGTIVSWGSGMSTPVGPNIVGIAPGVSLRGDGRVISSYSGPAGLTNVVEIAGGGNRELARRSDGTVAVWGVTQQYPLSGMTNIIGIGCGQFHSLAALGDGTLLITTQPADRKVEVGSQTLFRVVAAGEGPLRYQWLHNGFALTGETNFWLRLTNVQSSEAGTYAVEVSNLGHSLKSRVARLDLRVPPLALGPAVDAPKLVWTSPGSAPWFGETNITRDGRAAVQSGAIGDGQESRLQTQVTGPGILTFWWKVSSEEWFDLLSFSINGTEQAALSGEVDWRFVQTTLSPGTNTLRWAYTKDFSLRDGLDAGWLDAVSYSTNPPVIVRQPADQVVIGGEPVTLTVSAAGAPPLAYQWHKSGVAVVGATGSSFRLTHSRRHDSGRYAASVSNPGGTVLTREAQVLIRVPQSLGLLTWQPSMGVTLVSRDADGQSLLPGDVAGIEIQVSTNLEDWNTLSRGLILTNGTLLLLDPEGVADRQRFYRAVER